MDVGYLRELCGYWAERYDPGRLPGLLNAFSNYRWQGLHLIHEKPRGSRRAAFAFPAAPPRGTPRATIPPGGNLSRPRANHLLP